MAHERLKQRVAELLGGALGLNVFPKSIALLWHSGQPTLMRNNPFLAGIRMSVLYASVFCGIPWLFSFLFQFPEPTGSLFLLQLYGSLWSGWATTSTRITSSAISKTIENNIIPELSADTAGAIDRDLRRTFERRWLLCVSWSTAIFCAAAAGFLISRDVVPRPPIGEIVWWSAGWALLFATAAKVVNTSRFYRLFAAHLEDEPGKLYTMDPARSALVVSVASVAQKMLLFWFGIAVSIALVIPFSVRDDWSSWLSSIAYSTMPDFFHSLFAFDPSHNWFVLFDVLIAGFFSIGFGTIVFLRSEAAIRQAVKTATQSSLRLIEIEVANLSSRLNDLDEANWKRLTALDALHRELAVASSYRNFVLSGLSVIVPFVPLISLFVKRS